MGFVLCSLCLAVVRTIAGLNALQSAHETNQVSFAVAGRVLATTARGNFTLEDASGRTFIYNSTPADKRINPVTGICRPRYRGQRIFHQHSVDVLGTNSIRVLKPAPADRFTAPPLGDLRDLARQ